MIREILTLKEAQIVHICNTQDNGEDTQTHYWEKGARPTYQNGTHEHLDNSSRNTLIEAQCNSVHILQSHSNRCTTQHTSKCWLSVIEKILASDEHIDSDYLNRYGGRASREGTDLRGWELPRWQTDLELEQLIVKSVKAVSSEHILNSEIIRRYKGPSIDWGRRSSRRLNSQTV